MTTKTPEQIAEEAITADAGVPNHLSEIYSNTFEAVRDLIANAIKADRAQRSLPHDTAELQGALDRNDPVELLEIVNDFHTYQLDTED